MRRTLGGLTAIALFAASDSAAGALRVSPVGIDLPAGRAATTITLRNDDDATMNVQLRVFRWSQTRAGEVLVATDEVLASPPIAPLAPHSERVVRLVRVAADAGAETAYRLIVDELPPPPSTQGQQVRLLMRHSVPVFFTSAAMRGPKVAWSGAVEGGEARLAATNTGGRRLRVVNLRLVDTTGRVIAEKPGLVGYVLAGAAVSWTLPLGRPAQGALRLMAETDAGPLDVALASQL